MANLYRIKAIYYTSLSCCQEFTYEFPAANDDCARELVKAFATVTQPAAYGELQCIGAPNEQGCIVIDRDNARDLFIDMILLKERANAPQPAKRSRDRRQPSHVG